MKKKPLMIVGGVIVVLFLIVVCLPLFINANQFKPTLETQMSSALGRQVGVGDISLSILSGGVTVSDVLIADDPAFSKSPFLTTKSLSVGVALLPLIFSKKLEVQSITVKDPEVNLIHASNGTWNYSSLGGSSGSKGAAKAAAPSPGGAPGAENLSVGKVSIQNGKITMTSAGSSAKPSVYQNVNLEASDLSSSSQFPFKLTATGPGNAAIKVEGKAGPMDAADASLTPLSATVEVQHLDLANSGFVEASSGVAGVVDFKGDVSSDGKQMNSKGTVKANKLKLSATGAPSSVPLSVDYATVYTLKSQSGNLNQGDIHIGNALARLNGAYNTAGEPTKVDMKLNAQGDAGQRPGRLSSSGGSGGAVRIEAGRRVTQCELIGERSGGQADDCRTREFVQCEAGGIQLEVKAGRAGIFFRIGWRRWWFGYGDSNAERQRAERSIGNEN